jgi:hypothetical protein
MLIYKKKTLHFKVMHLYMDFHRHCHVSGRPYNIFTLKLLNWPDRTNNYAVLTIFYANLIALARTVSTHNFKREITLLARGLTYETNILIIILVMRKIKYSL